MEQASLVPGMAQSPLVLVNYTYILHILLIFVRNIVTQIMQQLHAPILHLQLMGLSHSQLTWIHRLTTKPLPRTVATLAMGSLVETL